MKSPADADVFLWRDPTGEVRVKDSAPASETDGAPVRDLIQRSGAPAHVRQALTRLGELARGKEQRQRDYADARNRIGHALAIGEIDQEQARDELSRLEPPPSAWQLWLAEQMESPSTRDKNWCRWVVREWEKLTSR